MATKAKTTSPGLQKPVPGPPGPPRDSLSAPPVTKCLRVRLYMVIMRLYKAIVRLYKAIIFI